MLRSSVFGETGFDTYVRELPVLGYFDLLQCHFIRKAFDISESMHQHHNIDEALQVSFCVMKGISLISVFHSGEAVQHAGEIAMARLAVLCARLPEPILANSITPTTGNQDLPIILEYIDSEWDDILPQQLRGCCSRLGNQCDKFIIQEAHDSLECASCLLERSGANLKLHQPTTTEKCFCGWIYDSHPSFFNLIGYPADRFAISFHDDDWTTVAGGTQLKCGIRVFAMEELGRPSIEGPGLVNRLIPLKMLLWDIVDDCLHIGGPRTIRLSRLLAFDIGQERSFSLAIILNLVIRWYRKFGAWVGKGPLDTLDPQDIMRNYGEWEFMTRDKRMTLMRNVTDSFTARQNRVVDDKPPRIYQSIFPPVRDPNDGESDEDDSEEDGRLLERV